MGLKIFSEQFRDEILKLKLKTPPDVVFGLVNISGVANYTSYIDALGKDAVVKTDKASVVNRDPGNIIDQSKPIRNKILNKNLKTPNEITSSLGYLSQGYLNSRGQDTSIGDRNVINPGDVISDSIRFRNNMFGKNLKTPNEIASYLSSYFINDIGQQIVINDYSVKNPGSVTQTIDYSAQLERNKLFKRNRPLDQNDPSESDPLYYNLSYGDYNYTSLLSSIGQDSILRDLLVPNTKSVSVQSNQTAETRLNLLLQQNRYIPTEINTFESTISGLNKSLSLQPYIDAYNNNIFGQLTTQTYIPSSFLNLRTSTSPLSVLGNSSSDSLSILLNGGQPPLEGETLLMNIAALELKFNFESRIKQAIERETIGRTAFDEALTNPLAAANIIRNPYRWGNLFERDYTISRPANPIGAAAQFIAGLGGLTNPYNFEFALSTDYDLTPKCFGNLTKYEGQPSKNINRFIDDLFSRTTSRRNDRDVFFLNRTGNGQKYSLFYSIGKNKYQPDYLADYQSGVFNIKEDVAQFFRGITGFLGIGAGQRPTGQYYIGSKTKGSDPFYLLQDGDGDQVRTNEELINTIKDGIYLEPGYDEVSEYGSVETDFIWKAKNSGDSFLQENGTVLFDWGDRVSNINKLSFTNHSLDKFRECSILYKTSQLLEKGVSTIDQTLTKFGDNYTFTSRGNATITPIKTPVLNKSGEITGYNYTVPGLINGKRDNEQMLQQAELCRVWTKVKPHSKISDLIRYKELNRKERNSVLERNGNFSIYPSAINSNSKKYMFSIENLAWRNYTPKVYGGTEELPNCEVGPNGGRIMWFPPYDLDFNENTSANWTTHQFLGRPEPIYTYNNSERSGTLSWKIIVDHPSVLNLLVKKELATLNDGEVNEVIDAFWAGCVEFDTFELARIWDKFSQTEIDYFKLVLGELNTGVSNSVINTQMQNVEGVKPTQQTNFNDKSVNINLPKSLVNGFSLFFENDVPLNPSVFKDKKDNLYDLGVIQPYHLYMDKYDQLSKSDNFDNANAIKISYNQPAVSPEKLTYNKNIGSDSFDNYFYTTNGSNKFFGFYEQYQKIENDLRDTKYDGFDLVIELESHASPIGPENSVNYNNLLSEFRFVSVVKWLISIVLPTEGRKIFTSDGLEITKDNIDSIIITGVKSLSVQRENKNGEKDNITFNLKEAVAKTVPEAIKEIYGDSPKQVNGFDYFETPGINKGETCFCFNDSKTVKNVIDKKLLPNVSNNLIGAVDPTGFRTDADIACSTLSIVSSYARRVTLNILVNQKPPKSPDKVINTEPTINQSSVEEIARTTTTNITKRDIAQRILNKLITECDYFDYLENETPIVYKSLKEKLKYFHPSFHSMTPEGLNARLTFLQQCMRPGDTIKNTNGESCDASNTAFGKPPVSILRIGDFYHTKIIINSLDISYEPLLFDLNPEGIGVQPMLANIQLSFKYIGGSGLRKHVDQLQNALSFNYYANTDVYDSRTFANTDAVERDLINQERSFFDDNTLDLIPIVRRAEQFANQTTYSEEITGTIGNVLGQPKTKTPGGIYGNLAVNAKLFDFNTVYQPYNVVNFNNNFYIREFDDTNNPTKQNTEFGVSPENNKLWKQIEWDNYGEEPFYLEFSKNNKELIKNAGAKIYFDTYEINYKPLFNELYDSFASILESSVKINSVNENNLLLKLLINKNYNKEVIINDNKTVIDNIIDQINETPIITNQEISNLDLGVVFEEKAKERGYIEFSKLTTIVNNSDLANEKINPIRAHLYPQKHMFKIGDGKSLINSLNSVNQGIFEINTRFNPGGLTSTKNIPGLYLKDTSNYSTTVTTILNLFSNEFKNKIRSGLNHFWFFDKTAVYDKYLDEFESIHKDKLNAFLIQKFDLYLSELIGQTSEELTNINDSTEKLGTLIAGLSIVLDGYDISKTETKTSLYEVIPNQTKLTNKAIDLFGYDPYGKYELLISATNGTERKYASFNEIRDIIDNKNNLINDYLSIGNGVYFFRQISNYNGIVDLTNQNEYTADNNLPISWSIRENTELSTSLAPNFVFKSTGVILNTSKNKFGLDGVTNIYDLSNTFISPLTEPDLNEGYYPMTYTFEKINYELFSFTNKTLDLMISDKFMNNSFDLDIEYVVDDSLRKQLNKLNNNPEGTFKGLYVLSALPSTDLNSWEKISDVTQPGVDSVNAYQDLISVVTNEIGKLVFVETDENILTSSGRNKYTDNLFSIFRNGQNLESDLEFYRYKQNNLNDATVIDINNKLAYDFTITDKYLNTVPVLTTQSLTNKYNSSVKGTKIKLSGFLDMLFIGFLANINSNDINKLKEDLNKLTPTKNISDNPVIAKTQINRKKDRILKITDDIFELMQSYVKYVNDLTKKLYENYNISANDVKGNFNLILTGKKDSNINKNTIVNSLIKGDDRDYTLTLKQAELPQTLNQIKRNYDVFTKNRNRFNIINE